MINRLIPLTEGYIKIKDRMISEYDIHELRWDIGYVLQQIALFPHMTIEENIAIVPEMKKWEQKEINQRIDELLHMVGLDPKTYRKRMPHELSGGQQQRIGVARALAANPPIILMDEPFSALDPLSREKLQDDLIELQKNIKKTIVFVTHDMNEALKLGDRICLMRNGEIVQTGTPEELIHQPASDFVREFVGIEQADMSAVDIREGIKPATEEELKNLPVIASHVSINEILGLLSEHEQLAVKEMDEIIGIIDRQRMFLILSRQMEGMK
jgi:osmoprotectant transport system ATP-binding protein